MPSDRVLLRDMLRKYATCAAYRDSGTVIADSQNSDVGIDFRTYFLRPAWFRFDWSIRPFSLESGSDSVIFTGDVIARRTQFDDKWIFYETTSDVIAESYGISMGQIARTLGLLMPEQYTTNIEPDAISFEDDVDVEALRCRRFESKKGDTEVDIFIDAGPPALRRLICRQFVRTDEDAEDARIIALVQEQFNTGKENLSYEDALNIIARAQSEEYSACEPKVRKLETDVNYKFVEFDGRISKSVFELLHS